MISYAADKGIKIPELNQFDEDPTLLMAEVDALSNICCEFPVGKKIILSISQSVSDEDFALTCDGHITLNAKILRSRMVTEKNIFSGGMFAASKLEDIIMRIKG